MDALLRENASRAHAEILLRPGPIPAGEERAFDARQVMRDLGPTIERPGGQP